MLATIKAEILADLRELTALDGISGHEEAVIAAMRERLAPLSDKLEIDTFGNIHALAAGRPDGYRLLLAAHSDEIGLMVKSIGKDGYLRFDAVGGVQPSLLAGRLVRINGHITGVIGVKSGHLQSAKERSRLPEIENLYIDVGASSAQEAEQLGISIGDPIAFVSPLTTLNHPDILTGKAIDDRLGCAVLLALMRRLGHSGRRTAVVCAITTQEEVGLRGAAVAAYKAQPGVGRYCSWPAAADLWAISCTPPCVACSSALPVPQLSLINEQPSWLKRPLMPQPFTWLAAVSPLAASAWHGAIRIRQSVLATSTMLPMPSCGCRR